MSLRGIIYNAPLALTVIEDKESIDYINSFFPYSVGLEFDTQPSEDYNILNFRNIPDIIEINNDNLEQRYRLPNGIQGMICLYNLLEQMKINNIFDELGGVHIHVDMTKTFEFLTNVNNFNNYILSELDKWEYKGTYNQRDVRKNARGGWVNFQSGFKTAEFRICEMSFDYKVLIKRIIHASEIITHINSQIKPNHTIVYEQLDNQKIITYIKNLNKNLQDKIKEINETLSEYVHEEQQNTIRKKLKRELISIVESRIIKMY